MQNNEHSWRKRNSNEKIQFMFFFQFTANYLLVLVCGLPVSEKFDMDFQIEMDRLMNVALVVVVVFVRDRFEFFSLIPVK